MTEKLLTNIISYNYITRLNKYVVELGIKNEHKIKVWLSIKQFNNLYECFDKTSNGYSSNKVSVIGVFNDKGYYCYSKLEDNRNKFILPIQYDLSDLEEDD